ncbi:MAG: phytanoyl-CoA dioxygenase family protein [Planctomycetaceae bacterium]|nr:phytanoyl-CoA dioxygenase family protein [Planctomycetaceae bacterium]
MWHAQLDRDGYVLVQNVYSEGEVRRAIAQLSICLQQLPPSSASVRSRNGFVYALRNLLDLFPEAKAIWKQSPLPELLRATLGEKAGLVRGLYFDKPPERSWSLPWHKDLAIAVRNNRLLSSSFRNPTQKAGVAHIEAPRFVLESMLTLRIHLDDTTKENGALRVLPGSHRIEASEDKCEGAGKLIVANAGDVLAMRPLLSHCSGTSHPETQRQRRIIHLEFAANRRLPDDFEWSYFQPLDASDET